MLSGLTAATVSLWVNMDAISADNTFLSIGTFAAGANNVQNIGICLIGNFDEERPTKAALDKLRQLIDNLRSTWKIPRNQVLTHQELKKTECPGRNLARWVDAYRRLGSSSSAVTASASAK